MFAGELREQVEKARRITEEQKVVLDKIRHVHVFFQGLETVCSAVKGVSRRDSPGIHEFSDDDRRSIHILGLLLLRSFHCTK